MLLNNFAWLLKNTMLINDTIKQILGIIYVMHLNNFAEEENYTWKLFRKRDFRNYYAFEQFYLRKKYYAY